MSEYEPRCRILCIALSLLIALPESHGIAKVIEDLAGRKVELKGPVERLVAVGPGALRLVVYLEQQHRIVGREDLESRMDGQCYVRPYAWALDEDFLKLPVVGPGGPGKLPDFEGLMVARPDVVVSVNLDVAQLENIQVKTGIPCVYLSYGPLGMWTQEVSRSLLLLGEILGRKERAKKLNERIEALQRDLQDRTRSVPQGNRPAAYFGGISYKGSHGVTSTQAGYPPAQLVHADNLADGCGKEGNFFVDKEQILVWNPDFIFLDLASKIHVEEDFEANRTFYHLLKASKEERVFSLLSYNYYNTNVELALVNAYFIGKCLYPERFQDVDMREISDQVFDLFLGSHPEEDLPGYRAIPFPESGPLDWHQTEMPPG